MIASRPRAVAPPAAPENDDVRTELRMLAIAAAAWTGAAMAWSPTHDRSVLAIVVLLAVAAASMRRIRWQILAIGVLLLASHLGVRADRGYQVVEAGPYSGAATVIGDPEQSGIGWSIDLRLSGGRRVRARAFDRWGSEVAGAAVGERVQVEGRLSPVIDQPWLRTRHIVGHLAIDHMKQTGQPGPHHALPTYLRERIAAGAQTMPDRRRALYLGLVIGDDRMQPLGQKLRFSGAGLTHLLAVSGQNVAFALAVARPALQIFGYRGRFVGLLIVLVLFAVITRLEPSVLRATVTAAITAWAALSGRERTGLTVLSLAVVVLIGIDPFLVDSVGFQLSVAASAAILLLGPAMERRLPGPSWLSGPLAVTLSAQLGVSPLLIGYFGPVSIASIPANLLAGWAAAVVMTLGLTVGIVAGLLPEAGAHVLQLPCELLLWWIEALAARHSAAPAPRYDLWALAIVLLALAALRLSERRLIRLLPLAALAVVSLGSIPRAPQQRTECGPGLVWYPPVDADSPAILTLSGEAYDRSVSGCLDAGVRNVDILVLQRGGATSARVATAIGEVMSVGTVVAPPQHRVIGARRQLVELRLPASTGLLVITPSDDGKALQVVFCCNNGPDG